MISWYLNCNDDDKRQTNKQTKPPIQSLHKKIKPNPQFQKRDRLHQTHHAVNLTQRLLSLLVIPPAVPTPLTPVQAQLISAVACVGSYCLVEQGALWFLSSFFFFIFFFLIVARMLSWRRETGSRIAPVSATVARLQACNEMEIWC